MLRLQVEMMYHNITHMYKNNSPAKLNGPSHLGLGVVRVMAALVSSW